METHPLARQAVAALRLPGPFRLPPPASIMLDHNLTPQFGPWVAYPDVRQRDVIDGIIRLWAQVEAKKGSELRLTSDNVLLTQGGVDALDIALSIFCEPGSDRVGITPPSFEAFPHWAGVHGLQVVNLPQGDWAAAAASGAKALLLCSPNNPLGNMIGRDSIRALMNEFPGIVILDEAYADFAVGPSSMSLVDEFINLVVLRTLSKSFGLAGLRVGALVGHPSTIRAALRVQVPFSVPSPIRAALLAALQHPASIHAAIAHVHSERARMTACLATSPLVALVYPSDANFLCVSWKNPESVRARLSEAGIRVRDFGSLSRVTIGSHIDNDALLTAVDASLKGAI